MALSPTAELRPSPSFTTLAAYEALAPFYDRFTHGYKHGPWLVAIDAWARSEGLRGCRLLDVACGTGKSFEPMLARGYVVTACDLSPRMVSLARARAAASADVVVADMRSLPWRARFDLVTCINDAINYLLTVGDLRRTLRSIAGALAPGGVAVFDANSLRTYRTSFAERFERTYDGCFFEWRGATTPAFEPGGVASATLSVGPSRSQASTTHTQRHWPLSVLQDACIGAGFERVLFKGQLPGGRLEDGPDENLHTKVVCLATKPREWITATCRPQRTTQDMTRRAGALGGRDPRVVSRSRS